MFMGEMFLFGWYYKMTNTIGLDICISAFYFELLQKLNFEIFAGGLWECETIFTFALFGGEAIELYCTLVGPKKHFCYVLSCKLMTLTHFPPFHLTATCGFKMGNGSHQMILVVSLSWQ